MNCTFITGYERDKESGLDYAQARYYNSNHGRFTSVDPLNASGSTGNPQSFNRYSYVLNNPYAFIDPSGLLAEGSSGSGCSAEFSYERCGGSDQFWGGAGSDFGDDYAYYNLHHVSSETAQSILNYEYQVNNAFYGGDSGGGVDFDIFYLLFEDGSYITHFVLPVHAGLPFKLRWFEKGKMKEIGERLDGFANGVTGGIPDAIDSIMGRDKIADSTSDAYQEGEEGGNILGIILPVPGGKVKVASKASGWVVRKVFQTLDSNIQGKVKSAIASGIVSPKGKQGIIKLSATEAAKTGYTHKIKILGKGGDIRIYGNQLSNGHIIFDKIGKH